VGEAVRRPLVALAVGLAALAPFGVAAADTETPQGTFSSPTRAVAGAPIWIRSITPCPVVAGAYQFVRVGISPQSRPNDLTYTESTDGDLEPDGSWEVTISAPTEMALGITKSFDVQVQCIRNLAPYATPDRGAVTETTLDPEVSTFRYFHRPLSVTGFRSASVTADGAADDTSTSTSTSSSSTTSTTLAIATTSTSSLSAQAVTTSTRADDETERAAAARAELAARGADGGGVAIGGEPVSATQTARGGDDGLPWWSFVAATMLAVGAVVAYGARRTTASALVVGQADGEAGGDAGVLLGEREVGRD
jgi:hypothetical protein